MIKLKVDMLKVLASKKSSTLHQISSTISKRIISDSSGTNAVSTANAVVVVWFQVTTTLG